MENILLSKLKNKLKDRKNQTMMLAFFAMIILVFIFQPHEQTSKTSDTPSAESIDTYIPAGFVLVPIEIQNTEQLSSFINDYAIVDLFSFQKGQIKNKVAQKLKLLRAPLNPQQFAVLVPESQTSQLLSNPGPFWVAVQNPNHNGNAEFQKTRKSNIEYFQGENQAAKQGEKL